MKDTREFKRHMAKIYLFEAQRAKHRNWAFWLLNAAGKYRRASMVEAAPAQGDLFGEIVRVA